MKSEITDFARGLKCGCFGMSSESLAPAEPTHEAGADVASAANRPSWLSRSSRASPPIPMPASIQNFRREINSRFRPWSLLLPVMSLIGFSPAY
jgi:hypothetical protein